MHFYALHIYTPVPEKLAASTFKEIHFSWTILMMGADSNSKTLKCTIYTVTYPRKLKCSSVLL
jgi:hypothetical protein